MVAPVEGELAPVDEAPHGLDAAPEEDVPDEGVVEFGAEELDEDAEVGGGVVVPPDDAPDVEDDDGGDVGEDPVEDPDRVWVWVRVVVGVVPGLVVDRVVDEPVVIPVVVGRVAGVVVVVAVVDAGRAACVEPSTRCAPATTPGMACVT